MIYFQFLIDDFFAALERIKTDPLWPLVIRIVSSIYPVRNQPVGPIGPRGNVISNGRGRCWRTRRHDSNLTSTFRKSTLFEVNLTSTVREPRTLLLPLSLLVFEIKNEKGGKRGGAAASNVTMFRTRDFFRSMIWLLFAGGRSVSELSSLLSPLTLPDDGESRPISSSLSCIFRGKIGLARPSDCCSDPLGLLLYDWFSRGLKLWWLIIDIIDDDDVVVIEYGYWCYSEGDEERILIEGEYELNKISRICMYTCIFVIIIYETGNTTSIPSSSFKTWT